MNSRFLQLHFLTSYGPANLNRDDLGQPKSAMLGNTKRLRVSSQSQKRAWRKSSIFESAMGEALGDRSKRFFFDAYTAIAEKHKLSVKDWAKFVAPFATVFGDFKKAKGQDEQDEDTDVPKEAKILLLSTLVFLSRNEQATLGALLETLAKEGRPATAKEVEFLGRKAGAADIALFGRMLASAPDTNIEAAAQIAHAVTVHSAEPDDDYFTAVDDLNRQSTGSAHLGELGFGGGVFYLYACIDRQLLLDNLDGDVALAESTIRALVECMATVAPTGKQNSFASRAAASYGLAELGKAQPRQLTAAFVKPVRDEDTIAAAIKRIESLVGGFDAVYGAHNKRMGFDVTTGKLAAASTISSDTVPGDTLLAKLCQFAASELE